MNRTRVHWLEGEGLPKHSMVLEAVPGVGNVGKLLVDGLIEGAQRRRFQGARTREQSAETVNSGVEIGGSYSAAMMSEECQGDETGR